MNNYRKYHKLELEYEDMLTNCSDEKFDEEMIKAETMFRVLFGWIKRRKGIIPK